MAYEGPGKGPIEYNQCRYGASKTLFRGPKVDARDADFAFVGGSEMFGKYVESPFVDLVAEVSGQTCVNFGVVNAGVDAFIQDPEVIELCSNANRTFIQVMGAHNMSNRFYSVHPRRNDRFIKSSALMQTVFREIDFTEFAFTRHLLSSMEVLAADKFEAVVAELQEAWVARMTSLLRSIKGHKTLLWVSTISPPEEWVGPGLGTDPLFVTRGMLDRLQEHMSGLIEIVLPPELGPGNLDDMLFPPLEVEAAREMLGPKAHEFIANAILRECERKRPT